MERLSRLLGSGGLGGGMGGAGNTVRATRNGTPDHESNNNIGYKPDR